MNTKGFTLIELLVIISIIGITSAFVFVDYGKNDDTFSLERASQKILQDIRLAQQKSLSGVEWEEETNAYGVYFSISNNNYFIYRNNNINYYYDTGDTIVETIEIPDEMSIESILNNTDSVSSISISFVPPEPLTYIKNDSIGREAFITLSLNENKTEKRTIKVNNSGRIEIKKNE
ncbi:MAG: prepilin-type N-terminal cleavage/methylation domain-containing protein [Candidatus Paceibacterota bacterium]|jgi:prepilin-type N-terminal cleavage/methylation domain-containing protein